MRKARNEKPGYGKILDFDGGATPLAALDDILVFLRDAVHYAVTPLEYISPVVDRWETFLDRVEKVTRGWGSSEPPRSLSIPRVFVVATGPRRESAFSILRGQWPGSGPPALAAVVSPFFDPPAPANAPARELWALLRQRGDAMVEFNLTAEDVPGEQAMLLHAPQSLLAAQPANRPGVKTVLRRLNLEEGRPLHAKSLWLQNDSVALLMMGSSNFTSAGLGIGVTKNLEANLAYAVSLQNGDAARALHNAWLPVDEIPVGAELRWQPRIDEDADCATASFVILPTAFGEASFGVDEMQRGFVEFTFSGEPPAGWMLSVEDEREAFLTEAGWVAKGRPRLLSLAWDRERAPCGFRVSWTGSDGAAACRMG
jgi:hypothetical protein